MELKTCEYCGLEFSAGLTHCPLCGRAAPAPQDANAAAQSAQQPAPQGPGKWLKKKGGGKYAAKHAGAAEIAVRIGRHRNLLIVEVTDDGAGGADPARGSGLRGLADRVAAVDGRLTVTSPHGGPTVIRAELPCGS